MLINEVKTIFQVEIENDTSPINYTHDDIRNNKLGYRNNSALWIIFVVTLDLLLVFLGDNENLLENRFLSFIILEIFYIVQ